MRLARFEHDQQVRLGLVEAVDQDTVRLRPLEIGWDDAVEALTAGAAEINRVAASSPAMDTPFKDLRAPVGQRGKLICAAMNYHEHVAEVTPQAFVKEAIVPKLFIKPSTSIIGPHAELALPTTSDTVDWELELAVVIGTGGRNIEKADVFEHIAGYTVINDISARTSHWGMGERAPSHWADFFDWLMGKWADGFAPMGPWLVSADEVTDPQALDLELSVNGEVRQSASTAQMIFNVQELIAFASTFMTLESGDVIATGTPSGVGATTGTFLKPGDVMAGSIAGIGEIRTPVVAPKV